MGSIGTHTICPQTDPSMVLLTRYVIVDVVRSWRTFCLQRDKMTEVTDEQYE